LRPEVEKAELELFWKGELAIEDSEEEKEDPKVCSFPDLRSMLVLFIECVTDLD
jgi:hypothetical protein